MAQGKKTGGGSRKGKPNVVTAKAREAIGRFVDMNASRMQGWLDSIANGMPGNEETGIKPIQPDPQAAFNMLKDVIEYHVPKLQRTEVTGKSGKAVSLEVKIV